MRALWCLAGFSSLLLVAAETSAERLAKDQFVSFRSSTTESILRTRHGSFCRAPVIGRAPQKKRGDKRWFIHNWGVGSIPVDGPIPKSVLALEGKTYHQLVNEPVEGRDHYKAMMDGLYDQAGYRTIRLTKAPVTIRLSHEHFIMSLDPHPEATTAEGIGLGSTLRHLV